MYQEKVVSNFIVALMTGQTLNPEELNTLKVVCDDNFRTPNPLVETVKNIVRGADVDLNDAELRNSMYSFVVSYIVSHDKDIQNELAAAKLVLSLYRLEKELKKMKESEKQSPVRTIVASSLNDGMYVTEHHDNAIVADAEMSLDEWKKFRKFSKEHGAKIIELA